MKIYRLKQPKGGIEADSRVVIILRGSQQVRIQLESEFLGGSESFRAFVQSDELEEYLEYLEGEDEDEEIAPTTGVDLEQKKSQIQEERKEDTEISELGSTRLCLKETKPLDRDTPEFFLVASKGWQRILKERSTGKGQYASPGVGLPRTPERCLELCRTLLQARKEITGFSPVSNLIGGAIDAATFPGTPIYVISSNRAGWLLRNFKKSTFYGPLIGRQPIVFVVGAEEEDAYTEVISVSGQGPGEGVYVLSCSGGWGIGFNRHCALLHAKASKLARCWMLDDNVGLIKLSGGKAPIELRDELLDDWCILSFFPGILQQALGFNFVKLKKLRLQKLNFCPFLAYSKEDLTLEIILHQLVGEFAYLDPPCAVIKIDKTTIDKDRPTGFPGRGEPMQAIAGVDVWREWDESGTERVDPVRLGISSYETMKLQEQAIYDSCMTYPAEVLQALLKDWFSDAALT